MTHVNLFTSNLNTLMSEIENNGGASVWCNYRQLFELPIAEVLNSHTHGYSVGNNNFSSIVIAWDTFSPMNKEDQLILACLDTTLRYETIKRYPPNLGFWLDTNTNRLFVDPIVHVPVLADAMNLGASNGELAIWDIALAREIRLHNT